MDNPQESPVSREYVAGLITGEGWFGLTVQKTPRLKMRYGFTIRPRFAIQMDDIETMELLIKAFDAWGLAYNIDSLSPSEARRRTARGLRVSVAGAKRVQRLVECFLPYLTGSKKEAAETELAFITLRFSKPQNSPYTDDEFRLIEKVQSINGHSGAKRTISVGELRDVRISQKRLESSETTR